MNTLKNFYLILILLLIPTYANAMKEGNNVFGTETESFKRALSPLRTSIETCLPNQESDDREKKMRREGNYNSTYSTTWASLSPCWSGIKYTWYRILKRGRNAMQGKNICSLSNDDLWYLCRFLNSVDILRLSGACRRLSQAFNEEYWLTYLAKIPKTYSYLVLRAPPSPVWNRKAFFSHLWYSEGRITLAVKLGHPEALMLKEYSAYGAYIDQNHYLCPSGVIKHISGQTDNEKTEKLKEAERKKIRDDMEKDTKLREVQKEQIMCHLPDSFLGFGEIY
jgi:hypothetical protein